ncbi:hypothetical protein ACFRAE_08765 [Sphingobacterium sp. HJSM2_6]|uniref:hypothetical protein n=1 Tax=Sphingobacterium sp. HJSM2_6 TaxID=3366264 RepID=UPI003BCBF4F0
MNKIPKQTVGKSLDYSTQLTFANETEAYHKYRSVVKKLLTVNSWKKIANGISADFKIVNDKNEIQSRKVKKNDFIRIDIPGLGLPSGGGYDWVKVTELQIQDHNNKRKTFISLHPSPSPITNQEDIAHFFKHFSSSNILIKQENNILKLQYAGRNEIINTNNDQLIDNIRNFLVGFGAKLGASYPQWKALIDGLAKK